MSQLRSFRLLCKPKENPPAGTFAEPSGGFLAKGRDEELIEDLLKAQGFEFTSEPFFGQARRLTKEPLPLGSSLAAFFGYIYIQDRSSMLPAVSLPLDPGYPVLDMCASPGSKTGILAARIGPGALVLGNEPNKTRIGTLRANLATQNLLNCATSSYPGEQFPLAGWRQILLDPPCSGWGTVDKHPKVMEMWQGDKLNSLLSLQRRLLARAFELLEPGGRLVYSTCTTNPQENRGQVEYAISELGYLPLPLAAPPGFEFETDEDVGPGTGSNAATSHKGNCLSLKTSADGQGFFIAGLQKPYGSNAFPEQAAGFRYLSGGASPKKNRGTLPETAFLPARAAAGPGVDADKLPPGKILATSEAAWFLPEQSLALLDAGLSFKGFPLGKMSDAGIRVSPLLRCLMPSYQDALSQGYPALNMDETGAVSALLSGQSIGLDCQGGEAGLYYKGLPLCRLKVKGKRAMFTAR